MIVIDVPQNSDQWWTEKLGKPSASNASRLITNAGKPSQQRTGYLFELAAELITRRIEEGYANGNMAIGNEREVESRQLYEMIYGVKVEQVGVVYKDNKKEYLCSPDGLIKREYGLELKNVLPKTQVKRLLENKLPSEHFAQIQFSLYVTGFKFWDYMSYCPSMRHLLIRVQRDEVFLKALSKELKGFCKDLKVVVRKIK